MKQWFGENHLAMFFHLSPKGFVQKYLSSHVLTTRTVIDQIVIGFPHERLNDYCEFSFGKHEHS